MGDEVRHTKTKRLLAINDTVGKCRWDVYRHVLGRINSSIENGFYLEAVTLTESFITDRFESYMLANGIPFSSKDSFYKLICKLKEQETSFGLKLLNSIDEWRIMRNNAVHGMAKFRSVEEADWTRKMESIEKAAKRGKELLDPVKRATAHKKIRKTEV